MATIRRHCACGATVDLELTDEGTSTDDNGDTVATLAVHTDNLYRHAEVSEAHEPQGTL